MVEGVELQTTGGACERPLSGARRVSVEQPTAPPVGMTLWAPWALQRPRRKHAAERTVRRSSAAGKSARASAKLRKAADRALDALAQHREDRLHLTGSAAV